MAISTTYAQMLKEYDKRIGTIEEFEQYWLLKIAEQGKSSYNYYTTKNGTEVQIVPIDHFPQLHEYEIWCEGYMATGEHGTAALLGKVHARNFSQACHMLMCKNYLEQCEKINSPTYREYTDPGRWDYDPNRKRLWNCGLFWSKELASLSFG